MDTIFAVSSGAPPAAIAVLRISGPDAIAASKSLAGRLPAPRRAALRTLRDPMDDTILDHALVLLFPGPATATGEDLVELHLHGGRAVVAAVERTLHRLPGLRRAEPGEFTRRALGNGRIDLTEAEGLGDLLAAETESQRRLAILASDGGVRQRIEHWSGELTDLSARIEAELDFSDEEDVSELGLVRARAGAAAIAAQIDDVLRQPPVERIKDGVRVVLAGPPNSGKSALLNALVDREAAIVSPIAGTTRDRIDVPVQRGGVAYVFTDTAGLRDQTSDDIEAIGIDRARQAMLTADIIVWLGDCAPPVDAIWVHPRADMPDRKALPAGRHMAVSAVTGAGLETLWERIGTMAANAIPDLDKIALNQRQRNQASVALHALRRIEGCNDMLLIAEDVRQARHAFEEITGHSGVEGMLDALFGTFCIGK